MIRHVYDFDKTIYDGDSTLDFYIFCLKRYPYIIRKMPRVIRFLLAYKFGFSTKEQFKEAFYGFLKSVPEVEQSVSLFWDRNNWKIKNWYLDQHQHTDVIISASPEFLLEPICKKMDIGLLIASKVDMKTGKMLSENCYGIEKVRRLKESLPECVIEEFYSDSLSDAPLANLANKSFLVKGITINPWK